MSTFVINELLLIYRSWRHGRLSWPGFVELAIDTTIDSGVKRFTYSCQTGSETMHACSVLLLFDRTAFADQRLGRGCERRPPATVASRRFGIQSQLGQLFTGVPLRLVSMTTV